MRRERDKEMLQRMSEVDKEQGSRLQQMRQDYINRVE